MTGPACSDSLGCPLAHDETTATAALGPEVDQPIRRLDHVEIVLDDENGVALVDQPREDRQQSVHVLEVQTSRRFVEQVHGVTRRTLGQLGRELDPLGLAARERRGTLPEPHVPETDVDERLHVSGDGRLVREEIERLRDRHVENLGDVLPLERDVEGVAVVPGPLAHLARHVDVGQEVHLDLDGAVTRTCLATSPCHVETETAGLVTADLRFGSRREQLADRIEHARVRGGVRTRCAADGRLVHVDDLVDGVDAVDPLVLARCLLALVDLLHHGGQEDVADQRALAAAGDTGDGDETPERDLDVYLAQVVLARTADDDPGIVRLAAGCRHRDCPRSGDVRTRHGVLRP